MEESEDRRLFFITKWQLFIYIAHDLFNHWLPRPMDYCQEPKITLTALSFCSHTFVSTCMTSVGALRATAHVHLLVPMSNASFPLLSLFQSTCRNNEEENLILISPPNWRDENLSRTKGKTPMAPGSTVSVTYIPWRFHVTKYRKLLCPSSCHVTPRTLFFFFFPSCCLAVCAVSP